MYYAFTYGYFALCGKNKANIMKTECEEIVVPRYIDLPYRRGVGIMIVNKDKKVFVGKRIDSKNNCWQMPQGGIDGDETVQEAGLREMFEETNIKTVEFVAETRSWLYYDIPEFLIGKLWGGRYRGQRQKWILVKFYGEEDEINIDKQNREFKEWKWISLEELPEVVISFKKQIYSSVVNDFSPLINNF